MLHLHKNYTVNSLMLQIVQPFDNLSVGRNASFVVPPSPIVQMPVTPQFYPPIGPQISHLQQQQQPFPPPSPLQQHQMQQHQSQSSSLQQQAHSDAMASSTNRRQVVRGLQYKENTPVEARRLSPSSSGLTVDSFRLLSVLGRGHFGKVILSQYKNTGECGLF